MSLDPLSDSVKKAKDFLEKEIEAKIGQMTARAREMLEKKDNRQAAGLADEILLLRPGHVEAGKIHKQANERLVRFAEKLGNAESLYRRRKYLNARIELRKAIELNPSDRAAIKLSDDIRSGIADARKRRMIYLALFVLGVIGTYSAAVYVNKGFLKQAREYLKAGQHDKALNRLDHTLMNIGIKKEKAEFRVEIISYLYRKAEEQLAAGKLNEPEEDNALATFNALLTLDPGNKEAMGKIEKVRDAYMAMGESALNNGKYAKAEENFKLALKVDSDYTVAQDRIKEAIRRQKMLETMKQAEALIDKGKKNLEGGSYQDALKSFEEARSLYPNTQGVDVLISQVQERMRSQEKEKEEAARREEKEKEEAVRREEREKEIAGLVGPMVLVKGGCFKMGDSFGDGSSIEKPLHDVCVDDFHMGAYEVPQRTWKEVMGNNPSSHKACDNCPVENVSWNQVQVFLEKINRKTAVKFRLATEAEWEYACRARGEKAKYGTKTGAISHDLANYRRVESSVQRVGTLAKGSLPSNKQGLFEMSGNVAEWVQDIYDDSYYFSSPKENPTGSQKGTLRVLRGGSWIGSVSDLRCSCRVSADPAQAMEHIGFRLVRGR